MACQPSGKKQEQITLKPGIWRAVLQSPGGELPFGLDITRKTDSTFSVFALNGEERLPLDDAIIQGDSLRIPIGLFESEIVAKVADSTLTGRFTKYILERTTHMPFSSQYGHINRFTSTNQTPKTNLSGKWSVMFRSEGDSTQSVGIFEQQGSDVKGTFLTPTGDYRYLSGNMEGSTLQLSTFDGNHVYLFKAKVDESGQRLTGEFWSGVKGYETWTAVKNEQAALPDANSLTFLKKGYEELAFTFPDVETGKPVSLNEEWYKNKVVIVQLMGSWCPNCMDETKFLAPWYQKNKERGIEIIGLGYERSPDFAVSAPKLQKMKQRFGVEYTVLLAGVNDKAAATQTLPMIEKVMAFPSTIFIDKTGKVRRIHTGFSGPGTGKYYDEFVEEFNLFVDKLLAEEAAAASSD
ncbi:TlpA family protein disulfide reductase [Rhodocytophaga rosea]|uniref:TlpA family protein disulfide reductase n=2 Tax=Rhodocytophaga rosea TaxID=2704465 RepID=A0A6C0GVD5_9BACT|nr:TlpA family protein disulfide reductase [Rhodocytophaga rosea]